MKNIGVIILNWNGTNDTIECLESLCPNKNYDIFVLDNGSNIEQYLELKEYVINSKYVNHCLSNIDISFNNNYNLYLIRSEHNYGFAGGNNLVARQIANYYEYILLLNNDTEVPINTIESIKKCMSDNKLVAATCEIRFFYDKTKLWNAGGKITFYRDRKYFSQKKIDKYRIKYNYIVTDFITGCAMMIDGKYIRQNGLFTDKFFHGEEDFNFCLNAKRRGLKIGVDLSSILYHKVGQSLKPNLNEERTVNSKIIHYSNRIIDYKYFMGKFHWRLWRNFYICLILIKSILSKMKIKSACNMVGRIRKITLNFDEINKETFDSILSGKI